MKALETRSNSEALIEKLQAQIPGLMEKANVPGLSLAIIRESSIFWRKAFGAANQETGELVTEDTLFEAASLSKPVFAYACLKLVESGQLALDTPLTEYLPEPIIPNEPRLERLTMRHVLSHSTGFPNWRPDGKPLKIYFEPGERFTYSGEGYMYLQKVLTQVTGQNPAAYLRENFLEPMGLMQSWYTIGGLEGISVASPHDKKGKAAEKNISPEMYAAASLHCPPSDFANFMCAVMNPDPANPVHLSSEMNAEMLTPQIPVNDCPPWSRGWQLRKPRLSEKLSWGLGWGLEQTSYGKSIWHWGDNGKFRTFCVGYPEHGSGMIFMTNGQNGQNIITQLLLTVIGGEYPGLMWLEHPMAV